MRKIISSVLLLTCSLTYAYRDTETGIFLTRDPLGYKDGPNLYSYVHCNPITRFDALGLYGEDVHFYMTYFLAQKAGLGNIKSNYSEGKSKASLASVIAWSTQEVDVHDKTQPMTMNVSQRVRFHFRHKKGSDTKRNSSEASGPANQGIKDGDPMLFGIGLHSLQDSYSHEGHKDKHLSKSVDYTNLDPKKAMEMAKVTYEKMQKYASDNSLSTSAAKWDDIKGDLEKMFKGTTKDNREQKWHDFVKKQFGEDVSFSPKEKTWEDDFGKKADKVKDPSK